MTSTIMTASASDELSIINTIVLAFATDPMARWSWPDASQYLNVMPQFHPAEPHWYLPLMGVDPVLQGQGYGSALLSHALQQCDREGSLAYLESSNPRNIPLYKRHGFRIIGEIQSGSSPAMTAMLRAPSPLK